MTFAAGQTFPGAGSGTVTSVGLSAPSSDFTVTSSPVTTTGTSGLGWTVAPTSANTANAIVKRDSLGNFVTNSITAGTLVGSSVIATTLSAGTVNATNINPTGTVTVNTTAGSAFIGTNSAAGGTTIYGRDTAPPAPVGEWVDSSTAPMATPRVPMARHWLPRAQPKESAAFR